MSSSKQETCLCKACENFTCYDKALKEVLETVESQLLHGCESEEEVPEAERDPVLADPLFRSMVELQQTERRLNKVCCPTQSASALRAKLVCSLQARSLLCPSAFDEGRMGCVDPGGCKADGKYCQDSCGFKSLWSRGLRGKLVGSNGELKQGVNPVLL